MTISEIICEELDIRYINFENTENFIKLLDLIFKFKKKFNLTIRQRTQGFLLDTLNTLYDEIVEAKYEIPLEVKEFSSLVERETWII